MPPKNPFSHRFANHSLHAAILCFSLVFWAILANAPSQAAKPAPPPIRYSYADIADLARQAPIVVDGYITKAVKVPAEQATNVPTGRIRMLITLNLASLIRSPQGSPAQITYLADVPLTAKGKAPKLKKNRVIIFARPVTGKPNYVQLQTLNAQLVWSAETDAKVRSILRELLASGAPPHISGFSNAFYSAGTLPGEGETQIFLQTPADVPTSLVITRDGEGTAPRWAVSFGELVDASATQPAPDTLGWYRLACFLPQTLPATILEGQPEGDGAKIAADYAVVRQALGRCERTILK
jgi:hypothetical protein